MTRPTRPVGRVPFLLLFPLLLACEESSIPVVPEGQPRFTSIVIDRLNSAPEVDESVAPSELQYSVTAYYQLAPGWQGVPFDVYLYVESWSDDLFYRVERVESVPLDDMSGTVRFTGRVTVPNCGAIDELLVFIGLWASDDSLDDWLDSDWYFVDVTNTSSTPC